MAVVYDYAQKYNVSVDEVLEAIKADISMVKDLLNGKDIQDKN